MKEKQTMWIRSQGKALLIDADRFFVDEESDGRSYIYVNGNPVASYSTHERAMKVMDGIQNCLCRGTKSYHPVEPLSVINGFPPYKIEREKVFQMPKDDEVEV